MAAWRCSLVCPVSEETVIFGQHGPAMWLVLLQPHLPALAGDVLTIICLSSPLWHRLSIGTRDALLSCPTAGQEKAL